MKEKAEKSYIHYLSVLKCAGMLAVIGIHVLCTPFTYFANSYSPVEAFLSYFFTNALRAWAVPVFVMASGALFLNPGKEISAKLIWKKYISRLALVLVTFGFAYALMEIVFTNRSFKAADIGTALVNVYSGKSWAHMWFIYMMLGLYIFTPPLRLMISKMNKNDVVYLLAVLFAFNIIVPFGIYIPVAGDWLFFYVLGFSISAGYVKIGVRLSCLMIFAGILWCAFGQFIPGFTSTYGASLKYAGMGSPTSVLMAAGLFSLAKAKCKSEPGIADSIAARFSFGVYVVHTVFINFAYKFLHFTPDRYNVFAIWAAVYVGTLAGSLALVFVLRKIPVVRKYIL